MADPRRDEMVATSNAAADAAGIPRLLLLACGIAEGNLDPNARRPASPADDERYWPDVSGSTYQQAVRWDPDYHGESAYPGSDEVERVLTLQRDPARSARIAAANLKGKYFPDEDDAIFKALCRYNWPGGHGLPFPPAVAANYRRGIAEATTLLGAAPMPAAPTYNLDLPIITQNHDWDCAEQSSLWAITAAGRHPDDAWLEQAMLAGGIESTDLGLLVGDGSKLAAWISEQYSDGSPALTAYNAANVSFDDVRSVAGSSPVLLGGHHWGAAGHWTGVRGYDAASDTLTLANPGGTGPVYGWQTMTRQQFASIAPCSMVVVTAAGAAAPPAPVPAADSRDTQIAALRSQVDGLVSLVGYLTGDVADALQAAVNTLRANKPAA